MDKLGDDLGRIRNALNGRYYGLYPAVVIQMVDPENRARVKVRLPWSPDRKADHYEAWARLATLMAGNRRGTWFRPEMGDEVLVAFEAGDPRQPYILGSLWKGQDSPPEQMDEAGRNDCKTIRSREGVRITWQDTPGAAQLLLETPTGQRVTLSGGSSAVLVEDGNGNSITLAPSGITITAAAKVSIKAAQIDVSAGAVTVDAGMSKFSGVVQCDTLVANAVVASSYTPGAGNIA